MGPPKMSLILSASRQQLGAKIHYFIFALVFPAKKCYFNHFCIKSNTTVVSRHYKIVVHIFLVFLPFPAMFCLYCEGPVRPNRIHQSQGSYYRSVRPSVSLFCLLIYFPHLGEHPQGSLK